MNILYPILGFIAFGITAAIVLPIIVVILFVGVAALVVSLGTWKQGRSSHRGSESLAWDDERELLPSKSSVF
jgi:hypothetical protein